MEEPLIKIKINEMLVGRQWSRKTNSARFGCFGGLSPAACFLWMSLVVVVISGENSCLICCLSPGLANSPDFPVVQPASCSRRIWTLLEVLKAKVGPSLRKP